MIMTIGVRKFALTAHVTSSVGLLGSIAAFLALAIAGLTSQDIKIVRAAYLAMEVIARFVIVPLAFASLLTGLIQSLGTSWGLLRHYWVVMKLLVTVFATVVLLVRMELIGYAARLAAETTMSRADLRAAGIQLVVHAAGGLLALLGPAVLSVYKPPGPDPVRLAKAVWAGSERREVLLQRLTINSERILPLHAVGIFGNSMPGDGIMSRLQRRWHGHDELLLILWIIHRHASGNCFPGLILEFDARKFRDHAFAKIELDLGGGDLARNIGRGAGRCQFRVSMG
jgi:hypothetical protein